MIRKMCLRDLDEVMEIWLQGNLDAHPFVDAAYWHENAGGVREAIASAEVWVYDEGGILGFAGLQGSYVAGIFVKGSARRMGVGTALLGKAQELHEQLVLHVYRENKSAMEFYLRSGFRVVATGVDEATGAVECKMEWRRTEPV